MNALGKTTVTDNFIPKRHGGLKPAEARRLEREKAKTKD